jgi:hypothetical protein
MLYTIFAAKPSEYALVHSVNKLIFTAMDGSEFKAEKLLELLKPAEKSTKAKASKAEKAEKPATKKTSSKAKK